MPYKKGAIMHTLEVRVTRGVTNKDSTETKKKKKPIADERDDW